MHNEGQDSHSWTDEDKNVFRFNIYMWISHLVTFTAWMDKQSEISIWINFQLTIVIDIVKYLTAEMSLNFMFTIIVILLLLQAGTPMLLSYV